MSFLELIKNFINLEKYCAQLPNFIGDLCFLKLFPFQVVQTSHIISSCSDVYQLLATQTNTSSHLHTDGI